MSEEKRTMQKSRLEAFSDGVLAIIITIMVLELKPPHGSSWAEIAPLLPTLSSYVLSFVFIAIYWVNHHHMFQLCSRVTGSILWANIHLLFWLSLVPFVTNWLADNQFNSVSSSIYGLVLMMCGVAYFLCQESIIRSQGEHSKLKAAVGGDWKGKVSVGSYLVSVGLAWISPAAAVSIFVIIALLWLVPDRRIERVFHQDHAAQPGESDR